MLWQQWAHHWKFVVEIAQQAKQVTVLLNRKQNKDRVGDTGAQSVSPEFNALTGNNLGVEAQQNGECLPTFEQPPTDSTVPTPRN